MNNWTCASRVKFLRQAAYDVAQYVLSMCIDVCNSILVSLVLLITSNYHIHNNSLM